MTFFLPKNHSVNIKDIILISVVIWENSTYIVKIFQLHRPGIEPGPPAWQASILPLNHRCHETTEWRQFSASATLWLVSESTGGWTLDVMTSHSRNGAAITFVAYSENHGNDRLRWPSCKMQKHLISTLIGQRASWKRIWQLRDTAIFDWILLKCFCKMAQPECCWLLCQLFIIKSYSRRRLLVVACFYLTILILLPDFPNYHCVAKDRRLMIS